MRFLRLYGFEVMVLRLCYTSTYNVINLQAQSLFLYFYANLLKIIICKGEIQKIFVTLNEINAQGL